MKMPKRAAKSERFYFFYSTVHACILYAIWNWQDDGWHFEIERLETMGA